MPLFSAKVLAKNCPPKELPEAHISILQQWATRIENGDLKRQSEVSIHAPFLQQIMVEVLGYKTFGQTDTWTIAREHPIARGSVDLAIGHFHADKATDQIHGVFEVKGAKTRDLDAIMPGRHKSPVQQAWEYARDAKGCQWVLVSNYLELRLYAVSETSLVYQRFDLATLTEPEHYAYFIGCLHADNLLTGRTADLLQKTHLVGKAVTDKLYSDYKGLREKLIVELINSNPNIVPTDMIPLAQKLLDRVLFLAFAEDCGLIPAHSIAKAYQHADPYNPRPVYANFKGLFHAVDIGNAQLQIPAYNGGLFATDPQLDMLNVSDALCEAFKNLAEYDFASEISVTVLGHIFEQSIADLENIYQRIESGESPQKATRALSVSGKRKQDGVVYTPDNITAFIVENTLGSHLSQRFHSLLNNYGQIKNDGTIQWKRGTKTELKFWYAWQETLKTIKVVDPACGSSAFLVSAFDYLHAEYQRANDKIAELTGQRGVFDLNKEILNNNLFGVDINDESIEISKLSLWLKTAERGKPLTSLDANLKAGNSLGLSEPVPDETFCWQTAFPEIIEQGGFDVVLGNPPYVRQERISAIKPWLEQHYQVYHGVADLYAYFFELGIKLLKANGTLGYISSSTFFKTGSGKPLRQFLAKQTQLQKVVDFGDVQVFEGVTTYPAILVIQPQPADINAKIKFLQITNNLPADLNQVFNQQAGQMAPSQLHGDSWQLEDERLYQLRYKLTHNKNGEAYLTLKQVYGSPLYGIKTGLNEAFVIDRTTRDQIIAEDPASGDIIKPFLEGKDLKKWHAQSRDLWLIAIAKSQTRQWLAVSKDADLSENEAWEFLQNRHPALTEYLAPFAEKGRKRGDKGEFWWELRACAYYDKFSQPKIFYPDITDTAKFHLDQSGAFSGNTGYFYPIDNAFIAGLLNSKAIWFFLTGIADAVRGGFYRMFSQNLNRIPVPDATDEQQDTIRDLAKQCQSLAEQRYQLEKRFTNRLCDDLCPANSVPKLNTKACHWWQLDFKTLQAELKKSFKHKAADSLIPVAERDDWQAYFEQQQIKHQSLSQQLADHEAQLNQAVYKLFDLTPDEIALIESVVK